MNPKNIKNPLDRSKFREQYLSNLRLESSNNQKNQNANAIFKKTGETPSKPPDTRTSTERAGDIEGMKVELRSKLTEITDGTIASQIIGELSADQIRFALDKWVVIKEDMKKTFATGVPTSAFIAYLNRLIEKYQLTEGVETGLQQAGYNVILSNQQMLYGLPRPQIWNELKNILTRVERQFDFDVRDLIDAVNQNEALVPTPQDIADIQALPPNLLADVMVIANDINQNIPSNVEIVNAMSEINVGLVNRSPQYTEGALNSLVNILAIEPNVITQLEEIRRIVRDARALPPAPPAPPAVAPPAGGAPAGGAPAVAPPAVAPPAVAPALPVFGAQQVAGTPPVGAPAGGAPAQRNIPRTYDWAQWNRINRDRKAEFLTERLQRNPDLILSALDGKQYGLRPTMPRHGRQNPFPSASMPKDVLDHLFGEYMAQTNLGMNGDGIKMMGKGLGKAPSKPRIEKPYKQSITHLMDTPVEKVKPYTQFGRYCINKVRLEGEGIMAFRRPSGNTVDKLKTEKLSRPLAKVLSTLVGKGVPHYDDIANLSEDEKRKLHYICKECMVEGAHIPKMMGKGEAEEQRFNILRGEIVAGNDSPTIIKELKTMLLKFMNDGRIPRRQANEILQELLVLGK